MEGREAGESAIETSETVAASGGPTISTSMDELSIDCVNGPVVVEGGVYSGGPGTCGSKKA